MRFVHLEMLRTDGEGKLIVAVATHCAKFLHQSHYVHPLKVMRCRMAENSVKRPQTRAVQTRVS